MKLAVINFSGNVGKISLARSRSSAASFFAGSSITSPYGAEFAPGFAEALAAHTSAGGK